MNISKLGINLIKEFEGCRLTAYYCPAGVLTIGYGHTKNVTKGQTITQAQAEALLVSDLAAYEKAVQAYDSRYSWTQNEHDALTSFCYNLGTGSIMQVTASGQRSKSDIAEKMLLYNKANGKELAGLTRRRKAERAMFIDTVPVITDKPQTSSTPGIYAATVSGAQKFLNTYGYGLVVDGLVGTKTNTALVKAAQKEVGTTADGIVGKNTIAAFKKNNIKRGDNSNKTRVVQAALICRGYAPGNVDGDFGKGTETEVLRFQKNKGLAQDGIVGSATWTALLKA